MRVVIFLKQENTKEYWFCQYQVWLVNVYIQKNVQFIFYFLLKRKNIICWVFSQSLLLSVKKLDFFIIIFEVEMTLSAWHRGSAWNTMYGSCKMSTACCQNWELKLHLSGL